MKTANKYSGFFSKDSAILRTNSKIACSVESQIVLGLETCFLQNDYKLDYTYFF